MKYYKKIFYIGFLIMLLSIEIIPQEKSQKDSKESLSLSKIKEDAIVVFKLVNPFKEYEPSSKDSSLQGKSKKKKFEERLSLLNKEWKNKKITFNYVKVEDVKEDEELTEKGKKETKKIIAQMKSDPNMSQIFMFGGDDIETNIILRLNLAVYLLKCKDCFQKTGKFLITYQLVNQSDKLYNDIYIADTEKETIGLCNEDDEEDETLCSNQKSVRVEIVRLIENEDDALSIKKDSIQGITGVVKGIQYESDISRKLIIHLK